MGYKNREYSDIFPYDSNVDDNDKGLCDTLEDTKIFSQENIEKIIFACLNINSARNKIDRVSGMIKGHTEVRMTSESKMDNIFPDR